MAAGAYLVVWTGAVLVKGLHDEHEVSGGGSLRDSRRVVTVAVEALKHRDAVVDVADVERQARHAHQGALRNRVLARQKTSTLISSSPFLFCVKMYLH